jgi:hypothetical protein
MYTSLILLSFRTLEWSGSLVDLITLNKWQIFELETSCNSFSSYELLCQFVKLSKPFGFLLKFNILNPGPEMMADQVSISFPEYACSRIMKWHDSGEIESKSLFDWLPRSSMLPAQLMRVFCDNYAWTYAKR